MTVRPKRAGSHLITAIVERQFHSQIERRFDADGLYSMSIPIDVVDLGENDTDQNAKQIENLNVVADSTSIAST